MRRYIFIGCVKFNTYCLEAQNVKAVATFRITTANVAYAEAFMRW
jgi:hypothetical protein